MTHTDEAAARCAATATRRTASSAPTSSDFRLHIMDQCGRCHEEIAESYFETFHGKVSKLGYLKTAKCYDCHGAHDILPVTDPRSRLSRANIVQDLRASATPARTGSSPAT